MSTMNSTSVAVAGMATTTAVPDHRVSKISNGTPSVHSSQYIQPVPDASTNTQNVAHNVVHHSAASHHHESLPSFIRIEKPSDTVKLLCRLWTLLMSLFGFSIKLYGYLQVDATPANKSLGLYTSFIQIFGILCIGCLFFLQSKQLLLNKGHFLYDPHNGSLYLKAGLVGFTIGTLAYNAMQLGEDVSMYNHHPDCGNLEFCIFHGISFTYNVLQCLLLLLFSKVTFTFYPNLALLCLAHLIAVCMHSWFSFVADEFIESLDWTNETEGKCVEYKEEAEIFKMTEDATVFLFPMSIELYLIAGGFFAIMSTNVGKPSVIKDKCKAVVYGSVHKAEWNSHFSTNDTNVGFWFGILLVFFTIGLIAVKQMYTGEMPILPQLFHWFIFFINCLMMWSMYTAYKHLKKRKLNKHFHNRLDAPLLFIALSGMCVYSLFSIFAGYHGISHPDHQVADAVSTLCGYLSHFIQSVVQTCFLVDAMRRQAGPTDKSRNLFVVLLGGNLAMWVTQMFELNFEDVNPMQISLYGDVHWTLVTHIMGPLAIFFRFHSAACIFDIWHCSYRRTRKRSRSSSQSSKTSAGPIALDGLKVVDPKMFNQKEQQNLMITNNALSTGQLVRAQSSV